MLKLGKLPLKDLENLIMGLGSGSVQTDSEGVVYVKSYEAIQDWISKNIPTEISSLPLKPGGVFPGAGWKEVVQAAILQMLVQMPDVGIWDKQTMNCRMKIKALPGWAGGMTLVINFTREGER